VNEGSTDFWLSLLVEFEDGEGDIGSMHIRQVTLFFLNNQTRARTSLVSLFSYHKVTSTSKVFFLFYFTALNKKKEETNLSGVSTCMDLLLTS